MRRSLALVALLAAGWTECEPPVTRDYCANADRVWREGPLEHADGRPGPSCDVIPLMPRLPAQLRTWCGQLAAFRVKCRAAGFPTGGAK